MLYKQRSSINYGSIAQLSCRFRVNRLITTQIKHMKLLKPLAAIAIFCVFTWVCSTQLSSCTKKDTVTVHDTLFNLTDGLVGWYTFTGGSLQDGSGFNNNIVSNNAIATTDRFGKANNAFLFNGTSSIMRIANSPSLNPSAITLMAIVKLNGFYQGNCHANAMIMKGNSDHDDGSYGLYISDINSSCSSPVDTTKEISYGYWGAQAVTSTAHDSTDRFHTGSWMVLVFTYDGQTSKFYRDGVLKETISHVTAYAANSGDLYIGATPNSTFPYWFNGFIDEVRIYNRALNQAAINQFQKLTN
jgi:hypothetical protein